MPRSKREPQFPLLVRTSGVKTWSCPLCGHLNSKRVQAVTWKVRCGSSKCRAQFAFGEVFYLLPGGGSLQSPEDKLMPDWNAMPEPAFFSRLRGELAEERFQSGGRVNRLVNPEDESEGDGEEFAQTRVPGSTEPGKLDT